MLFFWLPLQLYGPYSSVLVSMYSVSQKLPLWFRLQNYNSGISWAIFYYFAVIYLMARWHHILSHISYR